MKGKTPLTLKKTSLISIHFRLSKSHTADINPINSIIIPSIITNHILQSPPVISPFNFILLRRVFAEKISRNMPISRRCEQNGVNKNVKRRQNLAIYLIISTHYNEFQDPFSPHQALARICRRFLF